MGRFAVRLGSFFRWFKSAEGIFALRTAVVTLALWIPAVVPSSAGFNYQHKGLWALIMAQVLEYVSLFAYEETNSFGCVYYRPRWAFMQATRFVL